MSEPAPRKPLLQTILHSSVIATSLAGLLTTVIGGYLLDLSKANSMELDREREKQQALITNQLQVLEALNGILADYKLAAEFVIYDIVERDGATLLDQQAIAKSIANYDNAAREFLKGAYANVFRARIYFADPRLCDQLEQHLTKLDTPGNLVAIDGALSLQVAEYKRRFPDLDQAQAKPRFKTIGLVKSDAPDHDLQSRLSATRSALRSEFDAIKNILAKLADTTVAKR
jgi:hypothetical protein